MEPALHQLGAELLALAQRRVLERGHHDERRALVVEQRLDRARPGDEAVVHRLEVEKELGDVLEELTAEDAIGHLVEGPTRDVDHARAPLPSDAVGRGEPAQQPTAEEVGHARGGIEEVERVPGGRGVHHDQVVVAALVDVEEALHRDVVVTLHEARGEVVVEPVVENPVGGLLVGRVAHHQLVPALLGVEHRGPELAAWAEPGAGERLVGHPALHVADALDAERVGEALGRVDGHHEHLAAEVRRRREPGRRRDRRLADPARAAEHDDLLRREQRLQPGAHGRAHRPSSAASASATIAVSRGPGTGRTRTAGSRSGARSRSAAG